MKRTVALLISALLAAQALAYQVTLPIQHRSKDGLKTGIRQGATELILRLTGQRAAINTLAKELDKSQGWVDQYSTTHRPNDPDHPWLLDVTYSKQRIQQLLDQYQLPHWKQAPTPVSVLMKTTQNTAIAEDDPRWIALRHAATVRGFTLSHLNRTPTALTHQGEAVELIVVTVPDTESSGILWSWYHQGNWQQWQQGQSEQWAEQAAETIATQLIQMPPKPTTNNLTPIHLVIDGVRDFNDYTQAIQTFKHLHNVQSMIDDGVKNDQLSLTLIADVPIFDIKQSLDDVQQLTPQTDSDHNNSEADLRYYWGVPPEPTPTPVVVENQSAVDEQAFPYDNAGKDDAPGSEEESPAQD